MYSFDVFDTLISRRTGSPRGVFLVMQKKLIDQDIFAEVAPVFAEKRYEAEYIAERMAPGREISIDDIYRVLAKRYHLRETETESLKNIEIETEYECTLPLYDNIERLKQVKRRNEQIVLISDMYLHEYQLHDILCRVDEVFKDIPIYVSCDCNATKASGKLYSYVCAHEGAVFSEWKHFGDNPVSDYNVPMFYGIEAELVIKNAPNELKKYDSSGLCERSNCSDELIHGMVENCCKLNNSFAYRAGVLYGGAILVPYVCWIIDECNKLGLQKLLFMSRDGFILKQIADEVIKQQGKTLSTDYVYVSRKVLRDNGSDGELAVEYLRQFMTGEEFAFVDFHGTGNSLRNIADKIGKKLIGFYYLLDEAQETDNVDLRPFTYVPTNSGMLEIFCRAPHGVVEGYTRMNGRIEPLLAQVDEKVWEDCGLFDYMQGVLAFTREYLHVEEGNLVATCLADIGKTLIQTCESHPDKEIASFIGDFPHSESNAGEVEGFAPLLSVAQVDEIYGERGNEPLQSRYHGTNIGYSLMRSRFDFRIVIKNASMNVESGNEDRKKERVIIYAAGRYGYEAFYRLKHSATHEVVAWVDMNYQMCDAELIESPLVIKTKEYDRILVCLNSVRLYHSVREMLISNSVEAEKISWVCEYWPGFYV